MKQWIRNKMPQGLKRTFLYFYYKYYRVLYYFKYNIPLVDAYDDVPDDIISPLDYFDGVESVAIIGKGASIFESMPKKEIDKCDIRVVLNRVDVESLEDYIGNKFEVQMTQHVSMANTLMPVFSLEIIKKYGTELLICNMRKRDERSVVYYNFFHDRVSDVAFMPDHNELKIDPDIYKYQKDGALTIASSLLRILFNVPSITKIVFAGVDAYHYGYSHKQKDDGAVFHGMLHGDEKERSGVPLLKYIFDCTILRNKSHSLDVYFPGCMKKFVDFPGHKSFKFY